MASSYIKKMSQRRLCVTPMQVFKQRQPTQTAHHLNGVSKGSRVPTKKAKGRETRQEIQRSRSRGVLLYSSSFASDGSREERTRYAQLNSRYTWFHVADPLHLFCSMALRNCSNQ